MGKLFSKYSQPWIQQEVSRSSTGLFEVANHSNHSDLCEVLKIQNFAHCTLATKISNGKIPSQFLDMLCIFEGPKTFELRLFKVEASF